MNLFQYFVLRWQSKLYKRTRFYTASSIELYNW